MTRKSVDVERVVREVLAEMGLAPPPAPVPDRQSPPDSRATAPASQTDGRPHDGAEELVVTSRVVTLAELGDRLSGVRRLVVPPRAVVTPAVRDELRRRNIVLDFGRPTAGERGGDIRLVAAVLGSRFDAEPLATAVDNENVRIEVRRQECLIAATDELAREIARPDTLGLVVSRYPAVALCLANRHPGVRAAWGVDAARLARDLDSVGANLLVVDPGTATIYQILQMVIRFCGKGPAACPEPLRERLA